MSDVSLDLKEQIARIDRALRESDKFAAEQRKLIAEHDKLAAEALKLDRDRRIAPWQLTVVILSAAVAGAGGMITLVKALGGW